MVLGISAGVSLALVVAIGAVAWYVSRPPAPKPWNTAAIVASYDGPSTEGEENTIVFSYVLENRSPQDYKLTDAAKPTLMARLEKQKSLSRADDHLRIDLPIFIPAGHRHRLQIHLNYRFKESLPTKPTAEDRAAFKKKLVTYLNEEAGNLSGFVLFDEDNRYEISFPKGW